MELSLENLMGISVEGAELKLGAALYRSDDPLLEPVREG